jgi:hypothetical protein
MLYFGENNFIYILKISKFLFIVLLFFGNFNIFLCFMGYKLSTLIYNYILMKKENILKLTWTFESYVNRMDNWIEFWFARDLQHLLWYKEWRNFLQVIFKAKTTLETSNENIKDHFVDINKMVKIWLWSQRYIDDIKYLI